jgi:hypothetical protein
MRAQAMPGEDPTTLPTPDQVATDIVALCLPNMQESGRLYDHRQGAFVEAQSLT